MKLTRRRVTVRTPRAQDARRNWPERESLLVRLMAVSGDHGTGEASPLPGYSPDRLDDVEDALATLSPSDVEAALQLRPTRAALGALASLLPASVPAARMALETAALDLLGRRHQLAGPVLLGAATTATRELADLLGPASAPTLVSDSERAVRAGFRHLKLKLGAPAQLERELDGVRAVRRRHGAHVSLRLDANGALSAAQIEQAWSTLRGLDIELFEEPGAVPEPLEGVLPLGLDESLQGLDLSAAAAHLQRQRARFVILKPMALGGLAYCWRLAERARELGVVPIVSHTFDGPFAWRAAAALALALPEGPAHGLAPHAGTDGWSARPLPVRQGRLQVWQQPGLDVAAEDGFS